MKDAARAAREAAGRVAVALEPQLEIESEADGPAAAASGAPVWQRDGLAVSARVRALLAGLRPVIIGVLSFWDHAVRAVTVAGRRIEIDPSGSYRLR